jgi:hypothetical protein
MRKLEGYAKYPFEGVRVGRSMFAQFILILINRLVATALAVYDPIILELKTLYNAMFGEISQNQQDKTDQMSETTIVKQIRKDFAKVVDKVEAAVMYKFGKKSTEHLKFYPHGVTPYKEAPLHDLQIKIEALEALCDEYVADLGAPLLAEVTAVKTAFVTERDSQLQLIGKVKSIIPNYAQKQKEMIELTYKAMLTILLQNYKHPEVMLTFFDEHLIYPKNFEPYDLTLGPQKRELADIKFTAINTLILAHIKGKDLYYFFAASPDEVSPATPSKLQIDEEIEIKCSTIPADKKYLIFLNPNDEEGQVQIAVTKS